MRFPRCNTLLAVLAVAGAVFPAFGTKVRATVHNIGDDAIQFRGVGGREGGRIFITHSLTGATRLFDSRPGKSFKVDLPGRHTASLVAELTYDQSYQVEIWDFHGEAKGLFKCLWGPFAPRKYADLMVSGAWAGEWSDMPMEVHPTNAIRLYQGSVLTVGGAD